MKKVVLCLNVPELAAGGWRDPGICRSYPGSGFLPYLRAHLNIGSANEINNCNAEDMLIVQEEDNALAQGLIEKGATGSVLFCLESPLFAPLFYDRLPKTRKHFRHQFLFQGGTDPVFFPSFDETLLPTPEPWLARHPRFCLVMSNKRWEPFGEIPGWRESKSWQKAVQFQLHDRRQTIIDTLANLRILDLFGKGWPNAPEIPAGQKISTLRRYQFGLCIENTVMPGYVTEKLLDCIVAGVVPVYSGAPDIAQYVPEDCFLYLDKFKWPSPRDAADMVHAGQEFLRSPAGKRFSYQGFAGEFLKRLSPTYVPAPRPHLGPVVTWPAES